MRWTCLCLLLLAAAAAAQTPAPAAPQQPASPSGGELQQVLAQQFGPDFALDPAFPPMMGDLDGDGQQDLVLVASSKNPLLGEADFHYHVVDPYDTYFGYGDPKLTLQFGANLGKVRFVLVAHAWRSPTPKAKFVIVNLPFEKLSLGRMLIKKKPASVLLAEEASGLVAVVFWDGKKYRWEPNYSTD